jgi:aspartyl/asparaginyl-tRNA synthetase
MNPSLDLDSLTDELGQLVDLDLASQHTGQGQRVKIQAWVHRFRPQAKHFFLTLRDGTAFAQAIIIGGS